MRYDDGERHWEKEAAVEEGDEECKEEEEEEGGGGGGEEEEEEEEEEKADGEEDMADEEDSDEEVEVEATVEGEAEGEAEEEAEGEAATAEDMVEPFDLPSTVQKLKLYFPSAASTAGVKPALEQMEREIYGEVKVGALNVRVRALSLEFGGMYTLSRST